MISTQLRKSIIRSLIISKYPFLTEKKLWLAPLAGYTDLPFRRICKEQGADVVVSEMVSADGIVHKQKNTLAYMDFTEVERPFGVQLFGSKPEIMAKATEIAISYQPDFIDINMGCPVKKVTKRGAGGALMADIPNAVSITAAVRKAMPAGMPLSVKFRSGIDMNNLCFIEFGKAIEQAGADLVILHPRTVKQVFTGMSNWEHIALLKEHLSIPVVGNGDIKSAEDAMELFNSTGCDAVMIGRGALGNPWIFDQIKDALQNRPILPISLKDKLQSLFHLIDYSLTVKSERRVVREIRTHICHYTKGLLGSASLRNRINQTESVDELKDVLRNAFS